MFCHSSKNSALLMEIKFQIRFVGLKFQIFFLKVQARVLRELQNFEVVCEFDWDMDDLEEFTTEIIYVEELSEDQKDDFKANLTRFNTYKYIENPLQIVD